MSGRDRWRDWFVLVVLVGGLALGWCANRLIVGDAQPRRACVVTEQSAVGRSASPGDVVPLPEYGSGCEVGDILVCATVGGSSLIAAGRIDVARCRD